MAGWSLRGPLAAFLLLCCASRIVSAEEGTFAQSLQVLANEGLTGTAEGLKTAEGAYHRAKRLAPGDGRVDYAWSIVLTRHRKFAEAETAFQKALEAAPVCLVAQTAQLRMRLRIRKYEEAVDQLADLAEMTGNTELKLISHPERQSAALWLGRAYAYLIGPLADPEIRRTVEHRQSALRSYLGGDLAKAFDKGRRELGLEHRKLQEDLALLFESAEDKKAEAVRAASAKLAQVEGTFKSASAAATNSQKTLEETVADLDAKLTGMQKQFTLLEDTERTLVMAVADLRATLLSIESDLDRTRYEAARSSRLRTETAQSVLLEKMNSISVELELTENNLMLVRNQKASLLRTASPLIQQRAQGQLAQHQVSGAASQSSANLQRWQKILQEQTRKAAETPVERTGRLPAMQMRMRSWGTYDRKTPAEELAAAVGLN